MENDQLDAVICYIFILKQEKITPIKNQLQRITGKTKSKNIIRRELKASKALEYIVVYFNFSAVHFIYA